MLVEVLSCVIMPVLSVAELTRNYLGSVPSILKAEAAAELACSHIVCRIDCCNSLLAGITSEQLAGLQRIQNHKVLLTSIMNIMTMSHVS